MDFFGFFVKILGGAANSPQKTRDPRRVGGGANPSRCGVATGYSVNGAVMGDCEMTQQMKRESIQSGATVADVAEMLAKGQTDWTTVRDWLLETRLPVADIIGCFASELAQTGELAEVVEAQQKFAVAAARPVHNGRALTWKVSKKGAVSVYGLNSRMPVTLYAGQWERLAKEVFGVEKFTDTALGQWIAGGPKSEFAKSDYTEKDSAWLTSAPFVELNGQKVTVSVSRNKV